LPQLRRQNLKSTQMLWLFTCSLLDDSNGKGLLIGELDNTANLAILPTKR